MRSSHDSELRAFLLGTASEDESKGFVLRMLASAGEGADDAWLQALADEDDLFDEYVRGELDEEAVRRFEDLVLGHPEGRRRVAFARTLAERAQENAEQDVTAMTSTLAKPSPADEDTEAASTHDDENGSLLSRLFAGLRIPAAQPAWALCLLILAVAVVQTYRVSQLETAASQNVRVAAVPDPPERSGAEIVELRAKLDDSAETIQTLRTELDTAKAAAQTAAQSPTQSASRPAAPKIVSILLAATVRGSADRIPTLDVPADADAVELQVDLSGGPDVERLRARLQNTDGFQVWGDASAETEGEPGYRGLRLQVPVEVFDDGDYTLSLEAEATGDGSWAPVTQHKIRIVSP